MRPLRVAVGAVVLTGALVACGVGVQEHADRIEVADLTLDPPATDGPDSDLTVPTEPPLSLPAPEHSQPPSTEPPTPTRQLTLYFIDGAELVANEAELPDPASLRQVLSTLETAPMLSATERSAVPPGLVSSVRRSFEGVTINVDREAFTSVDTREQQLLFGQIVLTLTGLPADYQPIDQVRFTIDGEPLPAPQRDGTFSEPGAWVTAADYELLAAQ